LIGQPKRRALIEWAERRDVLLVEDDPYGELYFPDRTSREETRPMKADDRTGRVIYLSSFSKTLAPGFRVAWVVAPPAIIAKFDLAKQAADICSGALDQRVIHQAIARGVLAAQGDRLRAHYQRKRRAMEQALLTELGDRVVLTTPRGGFFLWAALAADVDAEAVLAHALDARVSFVIGSAFFVDGSGRNTLRLSFSQPSDEELVEGVKRLAGAVAAIDPSTARHSDAH
jgi:2-aminoadipate transaminase